MFHLDAHGRTDKGKVRQRNEDHFVVATLRKAVSVELTSLPSAKVLDQLAEWRARILVVADGVGGVAGGELASGMAVETIVAFLGQVTAGFHGGDVERENDFIEMMERAVQRAHELIQATYGKRGGSPATTLTVVVLAWPRAYFVHVGDSRAYYLRDGQLKQLTRDQTTGDFAVELGIMSEEQARRAGLYNRLSSAVGGVLSMSAGLVDLQEGDVLLMCTDGLTKHVSDNEIAGTLKLTATAEETTGLLLKQALDAGASDNVTVIVVRTAEA
jgi:protein phosphatase